MEDDLNFFQMEDDLIIHGRVPHFFLQMKDDLMFFK